MVDRVLPSDSSGRTSVLMLLLVKSFPMLIVNECAMHGVLRFIHRTTEYDVLITGVIKIMHHLFPVAARLTACSRRHHDVRNVRRVIRLNPSRSLVSAPLALMRAHDPVLVLSGPNPLVMLVRHLLLLSVTVCLQDLFFVAIISVASPFLTGSLWRSSLTGLSGSMAVVYISVLWRALVPCG